MPIESVYTFESVCMGILSKLIQPDQHRYEGGTGQGGGRMGRIEDRE